ncbi:MAG: tetratricopeptide repeat protein, partial [Thermoanaerobaculales bacterium]|nr:tetratricopeptide repeat protein [Thermoanaerobaculales bacterium]
GLGFAERRDLIEGNPDDDQNPIDRIAKDAIWSVTFHEPWEVPIREHDLWLDHGFPTGPEATVPAAVQYGPKRRIRRASPKMLAFFEGVFRTLAETTEDEMDSGRWSKTVGTSAGALSFQLTLPDILEPPSESDRPRSFNPLRSGAALGEIQKLIDRQSFESEDELRDFLETEVVGKKLPAPSLESREDQALAMAIEAMDLSGRSGAAMARKALKLDPESPVAHLALAIHTRDPETAAERFRDAVAAAERALGPEIFADDVGHFWGLVETRPYMEARKGLADCLWASGDHHEAVEHYAELIRLNPNDNQGIRDHLAPAFLALGLIDEADELLEAYAEDPTASHAFNRALLAFQRSGDAETSRHMLDQAIEVNPHVPDILLGRAIMPAELPDGYTIGSFEEAVVYFLNADEAWGETAGALDWLESRVDG